MNREKREGFPPVEFHFPAFEKLTKEEKSELIAELIKRRNDTLRSMGLSVPNEDTRRTKSS